MATHSSVVAWRTPGTEEPGGLPSMGSHGVGHDCSDSATAAAAALIEKQLILYVGRLNAHTKKQRAIPSLVYRNINFSKATG